MCECTSTRINNALIALNNNINLYIDDAYDSKKSDQWSQCEQKGGEIKYSSLQCENIERHDTVLLVN